MHPQRDIGTLKYFYKAPVYHRTGNKQEELEICVQSQGFDLIAITETWQDSSHNCNIVLKGYMWFRKDRKVQ